VRHRHYVVTDIKKSTLPPTISLNSSNGRQHLVSLASVEDDALGEELQVIWEIEPGALVYENWRSRNRLVLMRRPISMLISMRCVGGLFLRLMKF
ncbi:hypothetical protein JW964_13685, partial [candidate division KSB1 bacterium]|nr:hypothetical protein [candidate division KSB1 bacterium]